MGIPLEGITHICFNVPNINEETEKMLDKGQIEDAKVFQGVARYGKFVVRQNDDSAAIERLIANGQLVKNPSGHVVINVPSQEITTD